MKKILLLPLLVFGVVSGCGAPPNKSVTTKSEPLVDAGTISSPQAGSSNVPQQEKQRQLYQAQPKPPHTPSVAVKPSSNQSKQGQYRQRDTGDGNRAHSEAKKSSPAQTILDESTANSAIPHQPASESLTTARAKSKRYSARKQSASGKTSGSAYVNTVADLSTIRGASQELNRERYKHFTDSPIKQAALEPVSTFSIDVDTGSYSNVRRMINDGTAPAKDAVRIEEFINYFSYQYATPDQANTPFKLITELGPCPWNPKTRLLHVGIKGLDIPDQALPATNLVFLIDVSGSMQNPDKLPLLVNGLKLLTNKLRVQDKVAIAVYAGASGLVLESTSGAEKFKISNALDQLSAGGSTNGAAGIRLAYQAARRAYIPGGINRIILATDGDFNVGTVNFESLKNLVELERQSGIDLTTLGFGRGNYTDHLMEQLADAGNGNYAYIDNLMEAQKALVEQMGSTLHTIAKDVKIQLEFNPNQVTEYRLIGYENRQLQRQDFNNDKVDAGEIGAGHTVTALYEIALKNSNGAYIDKLRYKEPESASEASFGNELAFLKLRYKQPDSDTSQLLQQAINLGDQQHILAATSADFRFAASVAAYAQLLRGGIYIKQLTIDQTIQLAQAAKGADQNGYRSDFIKLMKLTKALVPTLASARRDQRLRDHPQAEN